MPESKNTFRGGKMNKDMDERLMSNGEYRDAHNIEVSTSEGANVGAAQVIKGNTATGLLARSLGKTIGHVVDEKTDKILFLRTYQPFDQSSGPDNVYAAMKTSYDDANGADDDLYYSDDIIETNSAGTSSYIGCDKYRVLVNIGDLNSAVTMGLDSDSSWNYLKGAHPVSGKRPMKLVYLVLNNVVQNLATLFSAHGGELYLHTQPTSNTHVVTLKDKYGADNTVAITSGGNGTKNYAIFESERVFNFEALTARNYITGINLIDDMLFWTDNNSEPKKVNIKRLKLGTDSSGNYGRPTKLFIKDKNNVNGASDADWLLPHHATVAKLSPTKSINFDAYNTDQLRNGTNFTAEKGLYGYKPIIIDTTCNALFTGTTGVDVSANTNTVNNGGLLMTNTSTFTFKPKSKVHYKIGDTLHFKLTFTDALGDTDEAEVYAEVTGAGALNGFGGGQGANTQEADVIGTDKYGCKIKSITVNTPITLKAEKYTWEVSLVQKSPFFEFKFPRFSYRYKYSDGEYSTFAPWTEVAFVPGTFDYLPKKGFNLGMKNHMRYLKIRDWRPKDTPSDVVEISILYKETGSTNVYTIDKFEKTDTEWTTKGVIASETSNTSIVWNDHGSYLLDSDLIHAVVPGNQILRPWDNIPRKAKAQEIIANRIVYGNYLQNYNMIDESGPSYIKPKFEVNLLERAGNEPKKPFKSLKSLRKYQIGVVYSDKYGRETPVLTDKSAVFRIEKEKAPKYNSIDAKITTAAPKWASKFRFYVKETSNEYYSLAMDRHYDAKDGNIWLSFPSAERNKLQEDQFIILKKQHGNDVFVEDEARYRILDIKGTAPDYIKTENHYWGTVNPVNEFGGIGFEASGYPYTGRQYIDLPQEQWDSSSLQNIGVLHTSKSIEIKIRNTITKEQSGWYTVSNIESHRTGERKVKRIKIKELFKDDMSFTSKDQGTTMVTGLVIDIRERKLVNSAQFDGRFFVKIQKDSVIKKNLATAEGSVPSRFIVTMSKQISYIDYYGVGGVHGYSTGGMRCQGNGVRGQTPHPGHTGNYISDAKSFSWKGSNVTMGQGAYYSTPNGGFVPGVPSLYSGPNFAAAYTVPWGDQYVPNTDLINYPNQSGVTGITGNSTTRTSNNTISSYSSNSQDIGQLTLKGGYYDWKAGSPGWIDYSANSGASDTVGVYAALGSTSGTNGLGSSPHPFYYANYDAVYSLHSGSSCDNTPWVSRPLVTRHGTAWNYFTSWGGKYGANGRGKFGKRDNINNQSGGVWDHAAVWPGVDGQSYVGGTSSGGTSWRFNRTHMSFLGNGSESNPVGGPWPTNWARHLQMFASTANGSSETSPAVYENMNLTGHYPWSYNFQFKTAYIANFDTMHINNILAGGEHNYQYPNWRSRYNGIGETTSSSATGKVAMYGKDWNENISINSWDNSTSSGTGTEHTRSKISWAYTGDGADKPWDTPGKQHIRTWGATGDAYGEDAETPVFEEKQYGGGYMRRSSHHPSKRWWEAWWNGNGWTNEDWDSNRPYYNNGGDTKLQSRKERPDRRWFIDHCGAAQDKCGIGVGRGNSRQMDLSFVGFGTGVDKNDDWTLAAASGEQAFADAMVTPGTQFRFREDPFQIVYTITKGQVSIAQDPGYVDSTTGKWVDSTTSNDGENPYILNYSSDPDDADTYDILNRRLRLRITVDKEFFVTDNIENDHNLVNYLGQRTTYNANAASALQRYPQTMWNGTSYTTSGDRTGVNTLRAWHPLSNAFNVLGGHNVMNPATLSKDLTSTTYFDSYGKPKPGALQTDPTKPHYNPRGVTIVRYDETQNPLSPFLIADNEEDEYGTNRAIRGWIPWTVKYTKPHTEPTVPVASGDWPNTSQFSPHGSEWSYVLTTANDVGGTGKKEWIDFVDTINFQSLSASFGPNRDHFNQDPWHSYRLATTTGKSTTETSSTANTGGGASAPVINTPVGQFYNNINSTTEYNITSDDDSKRAVGAASSNNGAAYLGISGNSKIGLHEWGANAQTIEILVSYDANNNGTEVPMNTNPAIWETEPKEDIGLDIYYEATQAYPINIDDNTVSLIAEPGMRIKDPLETEHKFYTEISALPCLGANTSETITLDDAGNTDIVDGMVAVGAGIPNHTWNGVAQGGSRVQSYNSTLGTFKVDNGSNTTAIALTANCTSVTFKVAAPSASTANLFVTDSTGLANTDYVYAIDSYGDLVSGIGASAWSHAKITAVDNSTTPHTVTIDQTQGDSRFLKDTTLIKHESFKYPNIILSTNVDKITFSNAVENSTIADATTLELDCDGISTFVVTEGVTNVGATSLFIETSQHNKKRELPWWNCYSFANGVESDRMRDDFNAVRIDKGVKASMPLATPYEEERKGSSFIFSGIYNSTSGVNNTNQFIQAEPITKDLNPIYGSIQRTIARDTDLVTFMEDKVFKILAKKDALFSAGGSAALTASNKTLGQAIAFSGDYGISKDSNSVAVAGFRMYFTDRNRGAVLRLSRDGITPISNNGMKDYFFDNFSAINSNHGLIGTFDDKKDTYNLTFYGYTDTLGNANPTISFSESVKGFTSFLSLKSGDSDTDYKLINGAGFNNQYYTWPVSLDLGTNEMHKIYKHHSNNTHANFYTTQHYPSIDVILNDAPDTVKNFKTMNYEGSQSKIIVQTAGATGVSTDGEYYNNTAKSGWYVDSITTDQQAGKVHEFINKEGKWYGKIKGISNSSSRAVDLKAFNVQGLAPAYTGTTTTVVRVDDLYPWPLNESLQLGDLLFSAGTLTNNQSSTTTFLGIVTAITPDNGSTGYHQITHDNSGSASAPTNGQFIFFAKDERVNLRSVLGYYATVVIKSDSTTAGEIFTIGADWHESSK